MSKIYGLGILAALALCGGCRVEGVRAQDSGVWTEVKLPAEDPQVTSIFFVDKNRGWAVGFRGLILMTSDAGKTWEKQRGGGARELLNDVFFLDEKTGWVVGGRAAQHGGDDFPALVLKTDDGGKNWTRLEDLLKETNLRSEFTCVRLKGKTGWIFGTRQNFITENEGKSWAPLKVKVVNQQRRPTPTFVSEKLGFDVHGTTLFRTADGGRHWTAEDVTEFMPRNSTLNAEFFLSERVGFAVGNVETQKGRDALVMKTEDGGKTWQVFSRIERGGDAYSAFFADEKTGWIATHEHQQGVDLVLHTNDAGKSWSKELEFENKNGGHLGSLFFADNRTGFIPGPGRLFRRNP